MKMRSVITILIYLTVGFMTSMANEKTNDGNYKSFVSRTDVDTIINNLPIKVEPFDLNIVLPSSGVQFYKDGIIFLSSTKETRNALPDQLSFGIINARYAEVIDASLEKSLAFSNSSSFTYPCEAVTFSSDYNTMYFTGISKSDGGEKIYEAKFSEGNTGDWSFSSDPVSFCSDKSIYTHPALSADGKIMVFASNRPGSLGGMDLYASLKKDEKWSDPVNLGNAVNSSFNELYPFLDSENNLFFSSDNIQGLGGYDIYVCKFKSNTWEKPINLSMPVNTSYDDIAFTINKKDGKSAFYTVKQNLGKRPMQLYRVTMNYDNKDLLLTLPQYFTRPDISQMVILALEPAVQASDNVTTAETRSANDEVIYRVQFLTSFNPRTRAQISVDNKNYNVIEYLYSGAYRLCVGEFSDIGPAVSLQNVLMKNGYPQAFVVVIRNNQLELDPELMEEEKDLAPAEVIEPKPISQQVVPEVIVPETTKAAVKPPDVKKAEPTVITTKESEVKKTEPDKPAATVQAEIKDIIIYRVQLFSGGTGGSTKLTVENKPYMTYEYKYNGVYRTCIGEFKSLGPAKELQNISRKSGYPQAFVVAFKNNVRSTDAALFK